MDRWLKNNLIVKILAVVLALMLWMVVNQERIFVKETPIATPDTISKEINRVPITGYLTDDDLVILDMEKSIDLVLRGKRELLAAVTPTSYEVFVELAGYGEGKHSVPIKTKGFPAGVEVELRPAMIDVTIEAKLAKEMAVMVETVGTPRSAYTLETPTISPTHIQVKAARSQLEKIAVAKVFVNVDDAISNLKRQAGVKILDADGNDISAEIIPTTVEVNVPITPPSVTVDVQPTFTGDVPSGYAIAKVETNVNEVTVFGPPEVVEQIKEYRLPAIDLGALTSTQSLSIPLLDADIDIGGIVDILPKEVTVTITIVPSQVLPIPGQPILVQGLSNDDQITFVTPPGGMLDLTLEGAPEILQGITSTSVRASINVNGLPHGEYEIPIDWVIPTYTKLTKDIPNTVKVILQQKADETSASPETPKDDTEQPGDRDTEDN